MQLADEVKQINKMLIEHFGINTAGSEAIWRVVFSDDQYEHRYGTYDDISPAGLYLRTVTETRYVPKYRQWIQGKYILERLVGIPIQQTGELPATKMSYEPMWTFEDRNGNPLPPKWEAIKLIIDTVYAAQYGTKNLKKYSDPEGETSEEVMHNKSVRIDQIVEELFGEQSSLQGTTRTGESIIVPRSFERSN